MTQIVQLTITHTHAEGTLIEGTSRGDAAGAVLKANRWRWSSHLGTWYVRRSRDQRSNDALIATTQAGLEAAGFAVTVQIDNATRRPVEERVKDRAERAADRAERLDERAVRLAGQAQSAWAASDQISDGIPMGQPILVGHHSERRHRRHLDRMATLDQRGIESHRASQLAADRAAAARRTAARTESPITVGNRIERLEADLRRLTRAITGSERRIGDRIERQQPATGNHLARLQVDSDDTREQLEYWRGVQSDQQAARPVYSAETISAGDLVRICGEWRKVARVNAKTVSVETGYSWTDRAAYHKITDHRAASTK